jgi:hypothetical protein
MHVTGLPEGVRTGPDGDVLRTVPRVLNIDAALKSCCSMHGPGVPRGPAAYAYTNPTMAHLQVCREPPPSLALWHRDDAFHSSLRRRHTVDFRDVSLVLYKFVGAYTNEVTVLSTGEEGWAVAESKRRAAAGLRAH